MAISALDSFSVKDTLKGFDDFKNKQKMYQVKSFLHIQLLYSESLFNTLYLRKNTNVKKIPLDKINITKKALLFLSQASTHHSAIFTSQFPNLNTRLIAQRAWWDFSFPILFCLC